MSDHVEARAKVIVEVLAPITLTPDEHRELLAVLWDWNAEDWERGVMYGGGPGTIKPELGENPYRKPPLVLPTEPTWGIAVVKDRAELGRWERTNLGSIMFADRSYVWGPRDLDKIRDFIPLTDEQVARIEAAR